MAKNLLKMKMRMMMMMIFPHLLMFLNLLSQFGLRFDDIRWQNHINSLKPLGLNILLNSCCKSPVRCLRFADHTGLLSLSYNSVPLPFLEDAYVFLSPINSTFRVPSHSHSFLSISKEKPIPNMICLITKEEHSGSLQLLTQDQQTLF
ncbi:hypothetical protein OS493_033970 [Desmophyllum pertusum]|uniref:Uncharacterized protein n=1 Tax=Desmophyllum pertusum TaxID=174260 RepID=A0A9W9ZJ19_9CNID|nr:hypothetical protein OS493_033970 [Desmophyllum pertusum]